MNPRRADTDTFRAGAAALVVTASVMLAGCADLANTLGFGKNSPDEFAVVRHASLAVPPNFDLRPPEPGAPRPQEVSQSDVARKALLGNVAAPSGTSSAGAGAATMPITPGESALMREAGAGEAPVNIREVVRIESASLGFQDRSFTDNLLFWTKPKNEGSPIDAAAEAERLRRTKEGGKTGDATEGAEDGLVIKRKKGGLFGGLFQGSE